MKIKPDIPAAKTPGAIEATDIRFYIGTVDLKLKSVYRPTGASFTVVSLCPTFDADPIKLELALNFAALACAAPRLLKALKAITSGDTSPETLADANEAINQATRTVPTLGIVSPELQEIIERIG